jgi:hypothetical protein
MLGIHLSVSLILCVWFCNGLLFFFFFLCSISACQSVHTNLALDFWRRRICLLLAELLVPMALLALTFEALIFRDVSVHASEANLREPN